MCMSVCLYAASKELPLLSVLPLVSYTIHRDSYSEIHLYTWELGYTYYVERDGALPIPPFYAILIQFLVQ
jgi:hypothetical protein